MIYDMAGHLSLASRVDVLIEVVESLIQEKEAKIAKTNLFLTFHKEGTTYYFYCLTIIIMMIISLFISLS